MPIESATQQELSSNVNAILKRGHTVDRLSEAELQEVVQSIEALQKTRSAARAPEACGKGPEEAKAGQAPKPSEDPKAGEAPAPAEAPKAGEGSNETKAQRKKRLHARNMRYYRSFLSSLFNFN